MVFHELLGATTKRINQLYDRHQSRLRLACGSIQSSLLFFVDKVDQASSSLPLDAWVNIQAGLILAAHDLQQSNPHIKVFASIRQEAYANFESPKKPNVNGSVVKLKYELNELNELINRLTRCYEKEQDLTAFVGFKTLNATWSNCKEETFRYLHRHTLGRPRDFVRIVEKVSLKRPLDEKSYRQAVREGSAEIVGQEVFAEVAPFLKALEDHRERRKFLQLLPHNVLTHEEVASICRDFNGNSDIVDFSKEGVSHPFCELYLAGLLGVIKYDDECKVPVQRFKRPNDPFNRCSQELPKSRYYFLHPGLQEVISQANSEYVVYRFVPIGDSYSWTSRDRALVGAQRELRKVLNDEEQARQLRIDRRFRDNIMKVLKCIHGGGGDTVGSPMERKVNDQVGSEWLEVRGRMRGVNELRQLDRRLEMAISGE